MNYNRSSTREKWTVMKYMRDFDLMVAYAHILRQSNELSKDNIRHLIGDMIDKGTYNPRYGGSIDTGKFKIIQMAWYMFGYYKKGVTAGEKKRFVFSPLGNLLLDNVDDRKKVTRIFVAMLFGLPFRQPFSQMDKRFNMYPFRLIFALLRDERLQGKLYHDEVFYLVMFLKTVDAQTYEKLVSDILALRQMAAIEKYRLFKKDEPVVAQALHEWNYAAGIVCTSGIGIMSNDAENGDEPIGVLVHGNGTGRRTYRKGFLMLNDVVAPFIDTMLAAYPLSSLPYLAEEQMQKFDAEITVKMYSFYPKELLLEIGEDNEEQEKIANLLNIATLVNEYATNEKENDFNRFETALCDAFNLFCDVRAQNIGGAGHTDIECIYSTEATPPQKFDIEAKARKVKLMEISAGRLRLHREKIGSAYTVIVTPDYVRAVLDDIRNDQSSIIKSATLSNYLYQYITRRGRNISYCDLDIVMKENMGKDITNIVNEMIYANFGHGYTGT